MARIVLADDEASIRRTLKLILEEAGHQVETAMNGMEVEALFTEPPDLLITDIIMPERDGFETIQGLKARFPDLKIIAFTGGLKIKPKVYLEMAEFLGAHCLLMKPIRREEMLAAVEDALASRTSPEKI